MNPEIFADYLADLCVRSPLAAQRRLRWIIIANPKAGGFVIKSRWKKHYEQLRSCIKKASVNDPSAGACPSETAAESKNGLVLTGQKGHAGAITRKLIEEAASAINDDSTGQKPFYLIITAGGDGTSLEVLTALFHAPAQLLSCFAVLRLPLGTGNDGADSTILSEALERLVYPAGIARQRAIMLTTSTAGKGPFYAFNILSVGLDAFVTHMTNKMKGNLPGDFYKLWVDIASLLYDRIYRVGPMNVRAMDASGNEIKSFREDVLLLAMGESGHRTYGSGKLILPDERNVCAVKQMPMLRKIALKGLFTTGDHVSMPESILFSANRIELSGEYPILAQMDGESILLEKADFPVTLELTAPVIPVLRPDA